MHINNINSTSVLYERSIGGYVRIYQVFYSSAAIIYFKFRIKTFISIQSHLVTGRCLIDQRSSTNTLITFFLHLQIQRSLFVCYRTGFLLVCSNDKNRLRKFSFTSRIKYQMTYLSNKEQSLIIFLSEYAYTNEFSETFIQFLSPPRASSSACPLTINLYFASNRCLHCSITFKLSSYPRSEQNFNIFT